MRRKDKKNQEKEKYKKKGFPTFPRTSKRVPEICGPQKRLMRQNMKPKKKLQKMFI